MVAKVDVRSHQRNLAHKARRQGQRTLTGLNRNLNDNHGFVCSLEDPLNLLSPDQPNPPQPTSNSDQRRTGESHGKPTGSPREASPTERACPWAAKPRRTDPQGTNGDRLDDHGHARAGEAIHLLPRIQIFRSGNMPLYV